MTADAPDLAVSGLTPLVGLFSAPLEPHPPRSPPGAGTALTFVAFKPNSINGLELGIGIPLFVAGIVTLVVPLATAHHDHVALTPSVHMNASHLPVEASQLPSDAPGLTLTLQM